MDYPALFLTIQRLNTINPIDMFQLFQKRTLHTFQRLFLAMKKLKLCTSIFQNPLEWSLWKRSSQTSLIDLLIMVNIDIKINKMSRKPDGIWLDGFNKRTVKIINCSFLRIFTILLDTYCTLLYDLLNCCVVLSSQNLLMYFSLPHPLL